jgi:hypothetical protein
MTDSYTRSYLGLALDVYNFAFTYIKNNNFFTKVNLPKTNSEYLKKNVFNYSTNVSPLIVTPDYNVLYAPCVVDIRNLKNTDNYYSLILPDAIKNNSRYYVCQFVDLFTNNFTYVSSKTNKNFRTNFKIFAPDYKGELNSHRIKANSWFFLILLRVEVNFRIPGDLNKAIAFEEGFKLITNDNSNYNSTNKIPLPNTTNIDLFNPKLPIKLLYNTYLDISQWQTSFTIEDLSYINEFNKEFGIIQNFRPFKQKPDEFSPNANNRLVLKKGQDLGIKSLNQTTNAQWTTSANIINTRGPLRYIDKALIAESFIYGNNKEEAIYWNCNKDSNNNQLNGTNDYTLTVNPIPSTNNPGFWSVTAYDLNNFVEPQPGQLFFTAGQGITKPCIITLSNKAPKNPADNRYLRVPTGDYYIILRIYNTDNNSINNFTPNPVIIK